jgi:hypothetical protein
LLNVKPIARVTTKKLSPENSGSYGDSPVQMQPVLDEEEINDTTPKLETNSSIIPPNSSILSPNSLNLNREEIAYHVKNIQKQFHLVKSQVEIIEVQKSKSGESAKNIMMSPRFKDSKATVFGYNPNL